jgi:hypothetical protein
MEWLIEEPFAWTAGVGILFVCVSQENSYHTYQRYLFICYNGLCSWGVSCNMHTFTPLRWIPVGVIKFTQEPGHVKSLILFI